MSGEGGLPCPLRAVIVDDEPPARDLLREYLAGVPGVEVVAECANGFEAVKAATELAPDLLLLDIQMPKLDGFEVLELLDPAPPAVIFTTAHEEHALRAFQAHAADYLLKPFSAQRLATAVERARAALAASGRAGRLGALAAAARRDRRPLNRVLVRDGARVHVIPTREIDYLEARDDGVVLHAGGRRLRKPTPLGELEEVLDPAVFVRIHRSYVLNVERLERLEPYSRDGKVAFLADGTRLLVSRSGYERLRRLLA